MTIVAEFGSEIGVVDDGETVFENVVRLTDFELAKEAEIVPGPSPTILDLHLQPLQLGFLCCSHHVRRNAPTETEKERCIKAEIASC